MADCIFCKIVSDEIRSAVVYEDDNVKAFIEIRPASEGHTLVIPTLHSETIYDLPRQDYQSLMNAAQPNGPQLPKMYQPRRVGLIVYGFYVAHAHVHLVPLHDGSEVALNHGDEISNEERAVVAEAIRAAL